MVGGTLTERCPIMPFEMYLCYQPVFLCLSYLKCFWSLTNSQGFPTAGMSQKLIQCHFNRGPHGQVVITVDYRRAHGAQSDTTSASQVKGYS